MRTRVAAMLLAVGFAISVANVAEARAPLPSTITYQAELRQAGLPVTTTAEFQYRLFDAAVGGAQVGATIPPVGAISLAPDFEGRFTQELDFGAAAYNGDARWLEISVRTGLGAFTVLPRQPLNPAPHSRFASAANNSLQLGGNNPAFFRDAGNLNAGTVPNARIGGTYGNILNLSNAGNTIFGTFTGNGAGITAINASNISAGTLGDGLLSSNVALLNRNPQTFTGNNIFNNTLTVNGALGLGTTSPATDFHILRPSASPEIRVEGMVNNSTSTLALVENFATGPAGARIGYDGVLNNLFLSTFNLGGANVDAIHINRGSSTTEFLGDVGVRTGSPEATLHVLKGSAGTVTANANSIGVFENSTDGYVSILTPAANESGVLFGTPTNPQEGGIVYGNPGTGNGLQFRTNGNNTRMTIGASGLVGIGTNSPETTLHVLKSSAGAVNSFSGASLVLEHGPIDNEIQFQGPATGFQGLSFGRPGSPFAGGVYYDHSIDTLMFRTTSNATRLSINAAGDFVYASDQSSLIFKDSTAASPAPELIMFATGTGNSDRMIIAHSPSFTNYGLQYQDSSDTFRFLGAGTPVMSVGLGSGNVSIGTTTESHRLVVQNTTNNTLRLIGPGATFGFDNAINWGDGSFVYIWEDTDDHATMNARLGWTVTNGTAAIDFNCVGTMAKGGGAFRIDHPLDPENKYLMHSFVESPDMKNIYDGIVTTDAQGFATVTLPDYFTALNKEYRYQLTVIDESGNDFILAKIYRKIEHNEFVIKTSQPGVEVSWQVTGIRQDAFANSDRIPNVVEKEPQNKGKYLHPASFGLPDSRGIYSHNPDGTTFDEVKLPEGKSTK